MRCTEINVDVWGVFLYSGWAVHPHLDEKSGSIVHAVQMYRVHVCSKLSIKIGWTTLKLKSNLF